MAKIRRSTRQPNPQVFIEREAFDDMLCISRATRDEVAWFAQVYPMDDEVYVIDKVFLPKQQSSGATVEIEPEHLVELAEEFIDLHGAEAFNRLHCWGHSHHTMSVGPSGQDQKTVDDLCDAIGKVFIAIRVNHRGEYEVDVAYPNGITIEDADAYIGWIPREKEEAWDALVKERVSRITYKAPKTKTTPPTPKFMSLTSDPWDDDDDITTMTQDERNAMTTEATTQIHRHEGETALAYLKRVEAIEFMEQGDRWGL